MGGRSRVLDPLLAAQSRALVADDALPEVDEAQPAAELGDRTGLVRAISVILSSVDRLQRARPRARGRQRLKE